MRDQSTAPNDIQISNKSTREEMEMDVNCNFVEGTFNFLKLETDETSISISSLVDLLEI
jgi:hypothetical protein